MRQLNVKKVRQLQDYAHNRYFVELDPGDEYRNLFMADFWALHRGKFQKNDWVRVRAHDGRFDVLLTVAEVNVGGIVMQRWPIEPPAEEAAAAREVGSKTRYVEFANDGKPQVRVDHTAATGWRVIGLNNEVVSQDHKDEPAALKAMTAYLKAIHYIMPTEEEQATHLKAHLARVAIAEEAARLKRESRARAR